nr:MAG TPA: hypothetical protein [Caudoviricetes sp.]
MAGRTRQPRSVLERGLMTLDNAPEQARELLDSVEGRDATALEAHMDWKDVAEALETIAIMHYEYAAQVEKDGHKYIVTDSDEGHWLCGDDHKVLQDWHPCYMDAEEYADSWNNIDGKREGTTARIVRRLVSAPEVVE